MVGIRLELAIREKLRSWFMSRCGILERRIASTPIAILDFETTGLTPGIDRVVEASVVRIDPGGEPRLVFDTLINPNRRMSATDIHGITEEDVADVPRFEDIAADLLEAVSSRTHRFC